MSKTHEKTMNILEKTKKLIRIIPTTCVYCKSTYQRDLEIFGQEAKLVDIIFWSSMGIILVWAILKSMGWI